MRNTFKGEGQHRDLHQAGHYIHTRRSSDLSVEVGNEGWGERRDMAGEGEAERAEDGLDSRDLKSTPLNFSHITPSRILFSTLK